MTTDAKSLAEAIVMQVNGVTRDDVGEFATDINLVLAGFKAALECEEVKALRDFVIGYAVFLACEGRTGDRIEAVAAVEAFDKLSKGEM